MNEPAAAPSDPSDATLMERVRGGDLDLLAELFERHHRRLYRFFLGMGGDRAVAEDLVQDVFMRMLKYRHTWRPQAEFVPWMFALARNAAVDHFRAVARETRRVEAVALEPAPVAMPHAAARLEQRERGELLRAALDRLDHDKREVLLLARFGELRHERIAALLGISPGAVRVRLHRALKALREAYRQVLAGKSRGRTAEEAS